MKKNAAKEFMLRGLVFAGFGPVVLGIVYFILSVTLDNFSLNGKEVFLGIISTYLLVFIHAGTSAFHQIEEWSTPKSALCQLGLLYVSYTICYLINSWIPKNLTVILIYTAVFIVGYLAIWLSVLISIKLLSKKINKTIENTN